VRLNTQQFHLTFPLRSRVKVTDRNKTSIMQPRMTNSPVAPPRRKTSSSLFCVFGAPFVYATPRLFVCLFAIPAEVFQINVVQEESCCMRGGIFVLAPAFST
jgi:hypothetical protein